MTRPAAKGKTLWPALMAAAALLLTAPQALASRTASSRADLLTSPALDPPAVAQVLAPAYVPQGFELLATTDPHPRQLALFPDLEPAPAIAAGEKLASGLASWEPQPNLQRMQAVVAETWWVREHLGAVDSPNLYQAFGLDPHNNTDPLGLLSPEQEARRRAFIAQRSREVGWRQAVAEAGLNSDIAGDEMSTRGQVVVPRSGQLAQGAYVPMAHAAAFGVTAFASAGSGGGVLASGGAGALYGGTEKLVENALFDRSLTSDVAESTVIGGASGLGVGGAIKVGGLAARAPWTQRALQWAGRTKAGQTVRSVFRNLFGESELPALNPKIVASREHHTVPQYTGGREEQDLISLADDTHFDFHEFLDNWKLPGNLEPRSPAPRSFRGEVRPWGRENEYLEIFAADSAANRQFIVDNLRQAYKEFGIYDVVEGTFEREAKIFILGGPE